MDSTKRDLVLNQISNHVDEMIWNNVWQPVFQQLRIVRSKAYYEVDGGIVASIEEQTIRLVRDNFDW